MKWLLVFLILIGDFLNIKKKWQGFIFWILVDGILSYENFRSENYVESVVFGLYVVFAIYGVAVWRTPIP